MAKAGCVLFMLLAACSTSSEPGPDAASDAAADAAPDAAPDADPCWMRRVVSCPSAGTLIELCVPLQGCASYTCDGNVYSYCGPGM